MLLLFRVINLEQNVCVRVDAMHISCASVYAEVSWKLGLVRLCDVRESWFWLHNNWIGVCANLLSVIMRRTYWIKLGTSSWLRGENSWKSFKKTDGYEFSWHKKCRLSAWLCACVSVGAMVCMNWLCCHAISQMDPIEWYPARFSQNLLQSISRIFRISVCEWNLHSNLLIHSLHQFNRV